MSAHPEATARTSGGDAIVPYGLQDVTIAVVHYQTPHLLLQCLEAVREAAPAAPVIVIDTGVREPLPEDWKSPVAGVELVRHENHSYASAVNRGLEGCRTPLFVQMNADVIVRPETFDRLVLSLASTGAAMVGPLPVDADGRLQQHGRAYRRFQKRAMKDGTAVVPWLSGCLQMIRMDAVRAVGGMDTQFRFYNEDMEWCFRLNRAGYRCVLVATPVVHLGGASTPHDPALLVEGLRGGYLLTRRYRGPVAAAMHRWGVWLGTSVMSVVERDPVRKVGYRRAARVFLGGNLDVSGLGATLDSREPAPEQGSSSVAVPVDGKGR